jgi:hypothetical protein
MLPGRRALGEMGTDPSPSTPLRLWRCNGDDSFTSSASAFVSAALRSATRRHDLATVAR